MIKDPDPDQDHAWNAKDPITGNKMVYYPQAENRIKD